MNLLDFHSLEDDDSYVIISKAKDSPAVVVHINGDSDDVAALLEAAFQAIDGTLDEVVHH
jgi:hypothetical protein